MAGSRPNVLFVCVDAMRSDFTLGEYGTDKRFFEFFEREGTVFDTMISAASSTTPCVASFMTGRYPPDHGVLSLREFKLDDVTTLAQRFAAAGYATSAHVCGPITADTGLDAGFDTYDHRERDRTVYTDWYDRFLAELSGVREPWFTYLHLWEAHDPRQMPPDRRADELAYDASVRGVSEKLFDLLAAVDLDDTIVAVTGDHGESFADGTLRNRAAIIALDQLPIPFTGRRTKEARRWVADRYLEPNGINTEPFHNGLRRLSGVAFPNDFHRLGHGFHVYDFLTRVPFVIAGSGVPTGERIGRQVRQIDVFPTLLSAAGFEGSVDVDARDLLADPPEPRPAHVRAVGAFESSAKWLDGVRHDGWKFVKGRERPLRQLFDLDSDPLELHDVSGDHPEKAAELEAMVDELVERERESPDRNHSEEAEARMTDRLEDLGYL